MADCVKKFYLAVLTKLTVVICRLKWAGHVQRMGDEKLAETRKWRKKEDRKNENAMGGQCKERSGKSGRKTENNSKR